MQWAMESAWGRKMRMARRGLFTELVAALAIGDALAMTVLVAKGFREEDFANLHPGGKLGAKLLKVADLMHEGEALPLVAETAPMAEVLLEMSHKGFGVAGVTDAAGRLVGIVTDGDLRRHMDGLLTHTAGEVMTRNPRTIDPGAVAEKAVAIMKDRKITSLFVVMPESDGRALGILNIHDCLRAGVV